MPLRPPWWWDNPIKARLKHDAVGLWLFETGSNLGLDSSPKANHLTNNNSVSRVAGKVGQAASFVAASSQYFSKASTASLQITPATGLTMGGWVYPLDRSAVYMMVSKDDNSGSAREYALGVNTDGSITAQVFNGATSTSTLAGVAGAIAINTWSLVLVWWDPADAKLHGTVNNGTVSISGTTGTPAVSGASLRLGARGNPSLLLNGNLDQIGVWPRLLSAAERAYLYAGGNGRQLL
jgi:hypothetical protein